jgi:GntR family transcriptional regulator
MPEEEIDYEGPIPPYRQIADAIIGEIRSGKLRPNRPIPSEGAMNQRWGVARDTARRTVRYLREEGWVYTVPHRGTFVVEEPPVNNED